MAYISAVNKFGTRRCTGIWNPSSWKTRTSSFCVHWWITFFFNFGGSFMLFFVGNKKFRIVLTVLSLFFMLISNRTTLDQMCIPWLQKTFYRKGDYTTVAATFNTVVAGDQAMLAVWISATIVYKPSSLGTFYNKHQNGYIRQDIYVCIASQDHSAYPLRNHVILYHLKTLGEVLYIEYILYVST